jgi:glycosyltransferase involved in cell wall biosynthesis
MCAAAYAAALHEFAARAQTCKTETWVESFAPVVGGTDDVTADSQLIANWLISRQLPTWQRRRLYVDVTAVIEQDAGTGIQRTVKETIRALYLGNFTGVEPIAVELKNGDLFEAREWLGTKGLLTHNELAQSNNSRVEFVPGDILLMLDSTWLRYSEFHPIFERARLAKVAVITTIYDILPIKHSSCFVDGGRQWFENWFRDAIQSSDGLLCISRAVAEEVVDYVVEHCPDKKELKVGYWHLGSELPNVDIAIGRTDRVNTVQRKPYLVTVGTIEPRKSHALTLDAMEYLWAQGVELNLCFAGKEGWKVSELMERIRNHPELGKRLFWIEKPSDSEIAALYQGATGLIFLSIGEGFGLPLVEAAHYGIPIICSDIPVFREIAGEFATYVKLDTAQSVGESILNWWNLKQKTPLPDTRNMPRLTWEESAKQILKVVMDENWLWEK